MNLVIYIHRLSRKWFLLSCAHCAHVYIYFVRFDFSVFVKYKQYLKQRLLILAINTFYVYNSHTQWWLHHRHRHVLFSSFCHVFTEKTPAIFDNCNGIAAIWVRYSLFSFETINGPVLELAATFDSCSCVHSFCMYQFEHTSNYKNDLHAQLQNPRELHKIHLNPWFWIKYN